MKHVFVNQGFFFPPRCWFWFQTAFVHQSQITKMKPLVRTPKWVGCCSFKCMLVGGRVVCCQALKSQPVNPRVHCNQPVARICMSEILIKALSFPLRGKLSKQQQKNPTLLTNSSIYFLQNWQVARGFQNYYFLYKYTGFCLFCVAASLLDLLLKYKSDLVW